MHRLFVSCLFREVILFSGRLTAVHKRRLLLHFQVLQAQLSGANQFLTQNDAAYCWRHNLMILLRRNFIDAKHIVDIKAIGNGPVVLFR